MDTIINKIPSYKYLVDGKDTDVIGYPWITCGAIITLENILKKNFNILECGCGGSTIFYADRCSSVLSLESNKIWADKISVIEKSNKKIIHLTNTSEFVKVIQSQKDLGFDLISVDSDPKATDRLTLANTALPKLKVGGWLLLDNYYAFGLEKFSIPPNWQTYTFDDISWFGKGTRLIKKTL